MKRFLICAFVSVFFVGTAAQSFQVVHTETPVQSFFAWPNDPNFVPESVFMMRTDSLDYDRNIQWARMAEANANPGARIGFGERPTVVCRNFGCTHMNDRITRTFLFNSIATMFMANAHTRMHICEADPFTRACLSAGISFPTRAGVANAMINIPHAQINQVTMSTGLSRATIDMNWEMMVNGVPVRCAPTITDVVVPVNAQSTLVSREFQCGFTTDGFTHVSFMFNIDYIDLDHGIIGGYYSLGLQGPAMGGGTGYALFRLQHANTGRRMDAVGGTHGAANPLTIRPGEYAVEPLQR